MSWIVILLVVIMDKQQEKLYWNVVSTVFISPEPLTNCRNVDSLNVFMCIILGDVHRNGSTCYSNRFHDFSVDIHRFYEGVSVKYFFLCRARPVVILGQNYVRLSDTALGDLFFLSKICFTKSSVKML